MDCDLQTEAARELGLHRLMNIIYGAVENAFEQGLRAAFDVFDHAVFGINRNGAATPLNSAAQDIAEAGNGIRLVNHRLQAVDTRADRALQLLIRGAITVTAGSIFAGGAFQVARHAGKPPLSITVTPFPAGLDATHNHVLAFVFVSDPERTPPSRAIVLSMLYKFSPAESKLADLLLQGLDTKEAGKRMRITYHSVRSLLKSVFQKAGVSSQSALMRVMLSLPGGYSAKAVRLATSPHL